MKKLVLLATGGTIAGVGESGKTTDYKAGALTAESLTAAAPGLDRLAQLRCVQVCNVSSDDITAGHLLCVAREINTRAADPTVAGFVVTHGTNTLEETAFFLHLTVKTDKPVVLTGSIRPATALSADGPINLLRAAATAVSPASAGRGVLVFFGDALCGARDVQKCATVSPAAFDGRDAGRLGYLTEEGPVFLRSPARAHTTRTEFETGGLTELPRVALLYAHQDADPDIVDWAAARHDGLVIAGMGAGCYSEPWNDRVAALSLPVVRASRIGSGPVTPDSFYDRWPHVMLAGDLPPVKARILLQLGLTVTRTPDRLRAMFERY